MTATAVLFTVLTVAGLQPWEPLPAAVDSAMVEALDTLGIVREQMDFDRHWATGVHLADTTVIRAIQHVEQLPLILVESLDRIPDFAAVEPSGDGRDGLVPLVRMLTTADSAYAEALRSIGAETVDSLAAAIPSVWLNEESPVDWQEEILRLGLTWPLDENEEMEMETLAELFETWTEVPLLPQEKLLAACISLDGTQWPAEIPVTLPGIDGTTVTFCFDGPVRWVVGGTGPNTYGPDCPFELIVDLGGDDHYGEGIGGAFGPLGRHVALVVDLHGDDSYSGEAPVSQGCGIMGFGGIVDMEGDDTYRAGDFSQGAGLMGQGLFVDMEGDDLQQGGTFSQGAGCLGTGEMYDGAGDDFRRVDMFGQGFGGPGGLGVLYDAGGSDCYLAGFRYSHEPLLPDDNQAMSQGFGMGLRPLIAGGIGLLADRGSGNDTYRAEVFGQGCSYYYSLGMLYDEAGQDTYQAAQYSQGSGIHLAAGLLWDGDGDDSYFSRNGPAQGSAHDLSTGWLLDGGGNDWYCSDGGQALSLTNSAAVFIDMEGNDTYAVRGAGQGTTRWARGSSGTGLFLDMADDDVYLGSGADSTRWTAGEYGAGLDLTLVTPGGLEPQDPAGQPEELDLDSLFAVASEWAVGPNRDRVAAHQAELAARGETAVNYIATEHMSTLNGLAIRAMEKCFTENPEYSIEILLGLLDSRDTLDPRGFGNLIYFLGAMEDTTARVPLEDILTDPSESLSVGLRVGIVRSLGSISHAGSLPVLLPMAQDTSGRVRRQLAVTLGEIADPAALSALEELSADFGVDVRSAAEHAIVLVEETLEVIDGQMSE